jgi:hypothetical protein
VADDFAKVSKGGAGVGPKTRDGLIIIEVMRISRNKPPGIGSKPLGRPARRRPRSWRPLWLRN